MEDDVDEWTGTTLSVIPPLSTKLSDEDSGDEDDYSATINNLTGRFLREDIEVALKTRDQEEPDLDDQLSDLSFHEPNNQIETVVHEDNTLSTLQSDEEHEKFVQKGTTGNTTVVRTVQL